MSISLINSNIYQGFVNNLNQNFSSIPISITAAAGDVIFFAMSMTDAAGVIFQPTVTWNSQTFTQLPFVAPSNAKVVYFYLKVSTGGTAGLVGSLGAYSRTNLVYYVLRSSTNKFADPPIKAHNTYDRRSQTFTTPSLSMSNITAGDFLVSTLWLSGHTPAFNDVSSSTAAVASPYTVNQSIQNTGSVTSAGRLYAASTIGNTGNVASNWTLTPATQNMYTIGVFVFAESNYAIKTPTNPIVPGAPITGVVEEFTNLTSITALGMSATSIAVADGSFTAQWPGLAEGQTLTTKLPATNIQVTFTDGTGTVMLPLNFSLPLHYETLRDEYGAPTDLRDIVTNHSQFIGTSLLQAGITAVPGERLYWPTKVLVGEDLVDTGLIISPIGEIEINKDMVPITVPIYLQRLNGSIHLHQLTITRNFTFDISLVDWEEQSTSPKYDGQYPYSIRP